MFFQFPNETDLHIIRNNAILAPYADVFPKELLGEDLVEMVKEHLTKIAVCCAKTEQREAFLQIIRCCGIDPRMYEGLSCLPANMLWVTHEVTEAGTFVGTVTPGFCKERYNVSVSSLVSWFVAELHRWETAMRLKDRKTKEDAIFPEDCGTERSAADIAVSFTVSDNLRRRIDCLISECYGISCNTFLESSLVCSILDAKGLKLEGGIQPIDHLHIRINPDKTYSRAWQLLNPRKITFHEFIQ